MLRNGEGSMNRGRQRESAIDTRRYPRYTLETDLAATISGERAEMVRGSSLNINEAGLAGLFAIEWEVGTSVSLQFTVPFATAPVRVKAVVRNRTSYRYGFEFVDLAPEHRGTINRTCRMLGLFQ
jgi:PilZ domain